MPAFNDVEIAPPPPQRSGAWILLFKIFFGRAQRLLQRLGLWLVKLAVLALVKRDTVFPDVHKTVPVVCRPVVHFP